MQVGTWIEDAIKRIRYSVISVKGEDPEASTARVAMFIELFSEFRPPVVAEASKRIAHRCRFWPSIAEAREILIEVDRELSGPARLPKPRDVTRSEIQRYSQAGAELIAESIRSFGPSPLDRALADLARATLEKNGYGHLIQDQE